MRRRKLAWIFAGSIGLLALPLLAITTFLALSPHDYLLEWKLRKTVRIEVSGHRDDWLVKEISKPEEVAALVSAASARLVPFGGPRQWASGYMSADFDLFGVQARFIQEGAEPIVVLCPAHRFHGRGTPFGWVRVAVPGQASRAYRVSNDFVFALESIADQSPTVSVGRFVVDGQSASVLSSVDTPDLLRRFVYLEPDISVDMSQLSIEFEDGNGQVQECERRGGAFYVDLSRLKGPSAIRVTYRGSLTRLPSPSRFHDAPRPLHEE